MAADKIGIITGTTSLFLQTFGGVVTGLDLWDEAAAIGADALNFKVRLDAQKAKLRVWTTEWEIDKGSASIYFCNPKFITLQDQVIQSLLSIQTLLHALDELGANNKAIASASTHSVTAAATFADLARLADPDSNERQIWVQKMEAIKKEAGPCERLQWALRNGKAESALDKVAALINDIYVLLPPPKMDPAAAVAMNRSLHSQSIPLLSEMNHSIINNALVTGISKLKIATRRLEERAIDLRRNNVSRKARDLRAPNPEVTTTRSLGTFKHTSSPNTAWHDILVEWKVADSATANSSQSDVTYHAIMLRRVQDLARLLQLEEKPAELRTLPCLGVVTKAGSSDAVKFHGLIYRVPSTEYKTLDSIVKTSTTNPNSSGEYFLEDRFSSAVVLCKAVLYLHIAGWLHKGIRASNVLFFGQTTGAGSEGTGYDLNVANDLEWNLYRHPDVQGMPIDDDLDKLERSSGENREPKPRRPFFSAIHDIYSVGIVLLEIGLMKSVLEMYEEETKDPRYEHSATNFKERILETQVSRLGQFAGREYSQAVRTCIMGGFDAGSYGNLPEAFYTQVVRKVVGPNSVLDGQL
ncbi:kinase catalytic domain protein [Fusarium tjaetaba]|uniref:Kinase catalytic domain protein n=1 Tax=Fusarium tjaetaba TaxID=1567544 RepID=A0A8H5QDV6_9HYPO|nr:kinase catalytic domain protein [Fusarium tjaetaba]KAF5612203.1 kinase catalytic domain protein [Fusarium tjaetaba]